MTTQRQIPGGPYVNETGTRQAQIPGGPYLNDAVAGGGGGGGSAITIAAGAATASALAGGSVAASGITAAAGVATASSLTGSNASLPHFDLSGAAYEFRENTGFLLASLGVTFWVHHITTGALVAKITGLSTDASGIVGTVNDAAMTVSTEYRVAYEFSTGQYGVAKLTTAA